MQKPIRLPVLREDRTIEIPLTQGYVTVIDWDDVWLCAFNWSALVTPTGHVYATCDGRLLHRDLMGLGKRDGRDVDHLNGDTLNCRRNNLRVTSHIENTRNRKLHHNNRSGMSGVRETKIGTWSVTICNRYLGTFETFEEARQIRLDAEKEQWGVQPRREYLHAISDAAIRPERLVKSKVYNPIRKV